MLKWFRRSGHSDEAEVPFESRITEARMEQRFGVFMPSDQAEGEGSGATETSEYIPAAVEPSEDVWEHEKELYRKKEEEEGK